jgi:hypothetical protein
MTEEKSVAKRSADEMLSGSVDSASAILKKTSLLLPQSEWRVRVARYDPRVHGAKLPAQTSDGYVNILIHVRDPLSPYVVRSSQGFLLENAWQAAKVYPEVFAQRITKHQMRPQDVIWQHGSEVHAIYNPPKIEGASSALVGSVSNAIQPEHLVITPAYWVWRAKLERAEYAVRYPNGYKGRHTCMGALWSAQNGDVIFTHHPDTGVAYTLLSYIEARKRIYCALYAEICRTDAEFARLKRLLSSGTKLQIWEVDGPSTEWGRNESLYASVTPRNPGLDMHDLSVVRKLLHDAKHPFGHGYTIAALLLHGEDSLK